MLDPLVEEIIEELEQSSEKLSCLGEGVAIKWGDSERIIARMEVLLPIVENLNTVIQDLRSSIRKDS